MDYLIELRVICAFPSTCQNDNAAESPFFNLVHDPIKQFQTHVLIVVGVYGCVRSWAERTGAIAQVRNVYINL
jgi:hypothetical protein